MYVAGNKFYLGSGNNPRWHGEMQLPIIGATKISNQFYEGDQNSQSNVLNEGINSNPFLGSTGGSPKWVDDGDNKRDQSTENILNDEIKSLIFNPEKRLSLSKKAKNIVDGKGAERVCKAILKTYNREKIN